MNYPDICMPNGMKVVKSPRPHPIEEVEMVVLRATKSLAGMECEFIAYTTVTEPHKVYYNLTTRGFPVDVSVVKVVDFGITTRLSSTGLSVMGLLALFEAVGLAFTNKRMFRAIGTLAAFRHAATALLEAHRPEGNTDGEFGFEAPRRDVRVTKPLALPVAKWYNSSGKQVSRVAIERILSTSLLYKGN